VPRSIEHRRLQAEQIAGKHTKGAGKGSGLGLSQVLGFAKQSGGRVRIESCLGEGTSVHIYLPRAKGERTKEKPPARETGSAGMTAGASILLVDDDNAVREITRAMLINLGYLVLEAGSGGAALDLLGREANIHLIIVDFAMPGMNGAEVARQVRAKRPSLPILFVTGYADRTALTDVDEAHVLGKPFAHDELARKVRIALAGGAANVVRLRR
jgi:CheY-like chemotaxis protein